MSKRYMYRGSSFIDRYDASVAKSSCRVILLYLGYSH